MAEGVKHSLNPKTQQKDKEDHQLLRHLLLLYAGRDAMLPLIL